MEHESGPLSGIRVLDLSRILAGPYSTMILGDLGAEIIKIEQPGTGDGSRLWGPPWVVSESAYYLSVNRNKKSVALNLQSDLGREVLLKFIKISDVLIENFRVGTMESWGLDYQKIREINPGLIYCSISGYGQNGPYRDRPGYDFIIQAQGGIMSICGPEEGPPMKVGVAIVDITAGLYANIAILAALHERQRSGEGQYIDLALLDTQVSWLANVASNYLVSGEIPARYGNAHPNIVPYEAVKARDQWFALAVGTDFQFKRLCAVIGREALAVDPRFTTNPMRVQNRNELMSILAEAFRERDVSDWLEKLVEAEIPCAPINSIDQVFKDPQVLAREMVVEIDHPLVKPVKLVGSPLKLSRTPVNVKTPPPLLGEHTVEVLSSLLGYDDDQLQGLRTKGVIA
jgi:formyl-CoA transferase